LVNEESRRFPARRFLYSIKIVPGRDVDLAVFIRRKDERQEFNKQGDK
jgi:hypothetical protein